MMAFNWFHLMWSEEGIRRRKRTRIIAVTLLAAMGLFFGSLISQSLPTVFPSWTAFAAATAGGLLGWVLSLPQMSTPVLLRYLVRKTYSKPDMQKYLGEHRLEVDDQGIRHRTSVSETRLAWGALHRIESERDYSYWYINSRQAIVIPHQNIVEGSFPALLARVKEHYKPGELLQPTKTSY